ncbi:MAG TPA: baseplate J/gp47 family protein [Pyrinomonadaceae bacterium]|nr:baseplate J/gp47 family protein [Pyrinomonadaceae bacterium]
MPLQLPNLDNRRYQDLLNEALARIPVHNPEWTNFNKSDPGVTLLELFAFLTENLLYRFNQVPERNRRKFLQILGLPLLTASSAKGLVTFINERGPLETITLNGGLEVRAGQVPFRTDQGLDVLPIEAQVFYKQKVVNQQTEITDYYKLLYASYKGQPPDDADIQLYQTVPLEGREGSEVALGQQTTDGSLWIALMVRAGDKPTANTEAAREELRNKAREAIGGKTISLGVVPATDEAAQKLSPGGTANAEGQALLQYLVPNVRDDGLLPTDPALRNPNYKPLDARPRVNVLENPGVVEITLPPASGLKLWSNLDPLEQGVADFPPSLEDSRLSDRLITWLRIQASAAVRSRLLWVGINTIGVTQRAHIINELLPDGNGAPDQVVTLSRKPVVSKSVRLSVTANGQTVQWQEIDDLLSAGPEVQVPDLRKPPGAAVSANRPAEVFMVNAEAGQIKFGDGFRGKRPPAGAKLRVSYDYGVGSAGNVGAGSINSSPVLPAGIKVVNPVRTWNGTEAETVSEGEKQIARYLQHRDRLVNALDFETITLRTPGVDIGRVEVIPAFNPELSPSQPGDAPGAVTLMLIPRYDPKQPDAPNADSIFLNTICRYLDPRRLVTTELFLRGPIYKPIWVSVGISVVAGAAIAEVRESVKRSILDFLAPLKQSASAQLDNQTAFLQTPEYAYMQKGWPLSKPVTARELLAVASRVSGVLLVSDVLIAEDDKAASQTIEIHGLELPRVAGISVSIGEPMDLGSLRGQAGTTTVVPSPGGTTGETKPPKIVPVPIVPEEC